MHSPACVVPGQVFGRFANSPVTQTVLFTFVAVLDVDCVGLACDCGVLGTDGFTEGSAFVVVGAVCVADAGVEGASAAGAAGPRMRDEIAVRLRYVLRVLNHSFALIQHAHIECRFNA